MKRSVPGLIVLALASLCFAAASSAERWTVLPPTPVLPTAAHSGYVAVNGVRLWYAVYGTGPAVVMLHGGLANSNYWGLQVRALAPHARVIVIDSRCHGRSTCATTPIGYDLMARDVLGVMNALDIRKATIVGWSDGAIVGLDIAIHYPERLNGLFAFAANSDPSGTKDVGASPVFTAYLQRVRGEYAALSPNPGGYDAFLASIERMWSNQPHFTRAQLHAIAVRTWIVDADRDEAIQRSNTDFMAAAIPDAGELILPNVSHFAFLQDPAAFDAALLHFLQTAPSTGTP
jgi:pimeloyl-ACP methyl ester carboxylesterase